MTLTSAVLPWTLRVNHVLEGAPLLTTSLKAAGELRTAICDEQLRGPKYLTQALRKAPQTASEEASPIRVQIWKLEPWQTTLRTGSVAPSKCK